MTQSFKLEKLKLILVAELSQLKVSVAWNVTVCLLDLGVYLLEVGAMR